MAGKTDYLTVEDVARILSVGVPTVRNYIKRGELRAVKLGGKYSPYRIRRDWFDEFISERNTNE